MATGTGERTHVTYSLRLIAFGALAFVCIAVCGAGEAAGPMPFKVPADSTIPGGPTGDTIKLGKTLITDTPKLLPANVGNGRNCSNCHLDAGTTQNAGPFVGRRGQRFRVLVHFGGCVVPSNATKGEA
jgi:cytochrome c